MACSGQIWANMKKCGEIWSCMPLVYCTGGGYDSPYFMMCMALKTHLIPGVNIYRGFWVLR